MKLKKEPQSLKELCTRLAANIAESACITIESYHGDHNNFNCRREIKIIRNYFLQNVGHLFDNVCPEIKRTGRLRSLEDLKILIDFMFHENKQMLRLPMLLQRDRSLQLTSTFWAEKLGAMKSITKLDLSEINCNDEIIKAISDNCKSLEHLHVCDYYSLRDDGFLHLKKCTELRIIQDKCEFWSSAVSNNTIKMLVLVLPRLIAINYPYMGAVLSSVVENMMLPLKRIHEEKAEAEHVLAIARLCPNLERLSLVKNLPDDILKSLTDSNLKVDTLDLYLFPFAHVAPLLREKGKHLCSLYLRTYKPNAKEEITLIGLNCPFLKHLTWDADTISEIGQASVDCRCNITKEEKQHIFSNLITLKLSIRSSDFNFGIPKLCLLNASNIQDIVFIVYGLNDTNTNIHDIFAEILLRNTMTLLNRLRMRGSYFSSSPRKAFELIFNGLNNLKQLLYVSKMNADIVEYFKYMQSKIRETNLQLQLVWRNVTVGSVDGNDENLEDMEDVEQNEDEKALLLGWFRC